MKTFNRIISLLMVVLMLATSVPYTVFTASAADDSTESYTLTLESNPVDSFVAENSAEGMMSFFGDTIFDGCYGNQLSGVARELYDSIVKTYATNKKTVEYTHAFETPFTFNAEISGGSIVMNDELEEIQLELDYAMQAAMDAFFYDHPEVFWLRIISSSYGISASGNSIDGYVGEISDITIVPTEIYDGASSKASQYTSAVEAVLDDITVTENRYDTLKNIHDYICNNAWYNLVSEQKVHSSEPFFIGDGGVVCEGYAKTFKVICDRLEIPCVLVSGDASGAHMWNYVQMDDGKWYLVDATWDDQESQIYDTYFLANANTIGFDDVAISEERTERTDFSGTGIFSFTYPILSTTAYTIHIHEWDTEYTIDVEPTCTEKGSKSIHCTVDGCNVTKDVTEIDISDEHNYENYICSYCGEYDEQNLIDYGQCGESVYYTLDKDGNMRVFGEGNMYDYTYNSVPWYTDRSYSIKNIEIGFGVTSIGKHAFDSCFNLTNITIKDSVTIIGDSAFECCGNLVGITIPESVVSIGNKAFIYCYNLTNVIIPNSVTSIGNYAFSSCSGLTNITIGNGVRSIDYYAFYDCTNLTEITIPDGVSSIGDSAFEGCARLTRINVDESNKNYSNDSFGVLFNKDKTELIQYPIGSEIISYTIPNGVTSICDFAFLDCSNLTEITIPDSVISIGIYAFYNCKKLAYITLPKNVKSIDQYAFGYCESLLDLTIGEGVICISNNAFESCTNLKRATIPHSVVCIFEEAFNGCNNLENVHYLGSNSDWSLIQISSGNSYLANAEIHYCTKLEKINETCAMDGYETGWYCNDCKKYIEGGQILNKLGHLFDSEYTIDKEPSCTTKGSKSYHCLREDCNAQTNISVIPAINHPDKTEFAQQNPTCTEIGYTAGVYCVDCEKWIEGHEEIPALTHSWNQGEITTASTCKTQGTKTYTCLNDASHKKTEQIALDSNNHEGGTYLKDKADATCTTVGYTGDTYCSGCDKKLASGETVAPTNHENKYPVDGKESTCTEPGYTSGEYCPDCEKWLSGHDVIAVTDHNYTVVTTKATLSSDGKIENICVCGDLESSVVIPKAASVTLSQTVYTYDGKNKTPKVTVKDADGKQLIKNVDYKTSVASKRSGIGKYTVKVTFIGNYEGSKNVYFTIRPGKPATIKAASQTTTSVKLSWSAVSGAAGYTVYRYSPSKKAYVKAGTTEGTSFTVKSLYSATEYTFKVVAYGKTSGGKVYDSESYALLKSGTMPGKPSSVKSASQTTSSVKLSWSAVTRATGYNVYRYSPSKKAYVKAGSTTGTSYTVKSLYDGTKYTFRVVPYFKTSDGTIIESSSYALLKTATKTNTPTLSKVASSSKGKATLTWSAVDGETGYTVYYSTKKDSGFKKYDNFKADSKTGTVSGLTSGKTYYFKVRTYITTDSGYVYSAWSTVKSVKVK